MSEMSGERGKEARKYDFKMRISAQVRSLLDSGIAVQNIARMLGAEAFVRGGKTKKSAVDFDVAGFVDAEIKRGAHLILPERGIKRTKVILPSGEGELRKKTGSDATFERPEIIHRTAALIEVLSRLKLSYTLGEGINDPSMMRRLSYSDVYIAELKKLILVNDEAGNATFVVHEVPNVEIEETFLDKTKDELYALEPAGTVSVIIYNSDLEQWQKKVEHVLHIVEPTPQAREKAALGEYEQAPKGWVTVKGLSDEMLVDYSTVKPRVEAQRRVHPEWFMEYLVPSIKRPEEHIHPVLAAMVRRQVEGKGEMAPHGWVTIRAVAEMCGSDRDALAKRYLPALRKAHSEWFKNFLDAIKQPREHLHPDAVKYILAQEDDRKKQIEVKRERKEEKIKAERARIEAVARPPAEWQHTLGIAEDVLGDRNYRSRVKRVVENLKGSHPQWVGVFRGVTGQPLEYYHPEFVRLIVDEVKKSKKN